MRAVPLRTQNQQFAKLLRRNQTDAEKKLWHHLRNRQLAGAKFRRQQPFGPYILDFYCAEARLAIELDGGQHSAPDGIKNDIQRDEYLKKEGVSVLRFWNNQISDEFEGVLELICATLETTPLTRTLSPKGRGA